MITAEELRAQRIIGAKHNLPRFTYLGARAKSLSLDSWVQKVGTVSKYIDACAGSCNQPFAVGSATGCPVVVNDGSFYSYCIGVGLFHRTENTSEEAICQWIVDAVENPVEGYFFKMDKTRVPTDVRLFVDSLLVSLPSRFNVADSYYLRACVGRSFIGEFALRGMSLYPDKRVQMHTTPEIFAKCLYRIATRKNKFHIPGVAYNLHISDFLKIVDLRDATINFDPAWPFTKGPKQNPYHFYTMIGRVLKQEHIPDFPYWDRPPQEEVITEVVEWLRTCFNGGAREVYIWNQSTNKPTRETLMREFSRDFECEVAFDVMSDSTQHRYDFSDYALRVWQK